MGFTGVLIVVFILAALLLFIGIKKRNNLLITVASVGLSTLFLLVLTILYSVKYTM